MGSVGHLFRFLFERVEFVVKGGGERERKDYQQDQTNQSSRS